MNIPKIPFVNNFLQKLKSYAWRDPYRDWFFIVCFSALAAALIAASAGVLYYEINNGTIFRNDAPLQNSAPKIDRQGIESVSKYYSDKEKILKELTAGAGAPVDPGL